MKKNLLLLSLIVAGAFSLIGCSSSKNSDNITTDNAVADVAQGPQLITAEEAAKMMTDNPEAIILDVRTQEEYDGGHIKGAILIPDTDITSKAEEILKDKSASILVYCRSGRRSALAAKDLVDLGYTSVYDFGGIIDWPYDVVTE